MEKTLRKIVQRGPILWFMSAPRSLPRQHPPCKCPFPPPPPHMVHIFASVHPSVNLYIYISINLFVCFKLGGGLYLWIFAANLLIAFSRAFICSECLGPCMTLSSSLMRVCVCVKETNKQDVLFLWWMGSQRKGHKESVTKKGPQRITKGHNGTQRVTDTWYGCLPSIVDTYDISVYIIKANQGEGGGERGREKHKWY